ncbi:glycosyltransferase family 32 protein [Rugamonas fusca]|uniref:glycosyltransferase family 32 protein n=1 Tax=Rugamonas fusca TaxID=2758568 RepID=UPI001C70C6A1|nr:glycosyltransferase [Rugamonas fusca]
MIPKIIHLCWFGGGPMSPLHRKCVDSWRKYCPDYEIRTWNERNTDLDNEYCRAAIQRRKWAFVSDWARFDILYRHGGVYLDTDIELIRPIDDLLGLGGCVNVQETARAVSSGVIACEAGDPVIGRARQLILDELIPKHLFVASPLILQRALDLDGGATNHTLPSKTFFPFNPYDHDIDPNPRQLMYGDITPATYGIHHYRLGAEWADSRPKRALARALGLLGLRLRWRIAYDAFGAAAA